MTKIHGMVLSMKNMANAAKAFAVFTFTWTGIPLFTAARN